MLFGKLLPREGNFFEMFNQHADCIVDAAHFAGLLRVASAERAVTTPLAPYGRSLADYAAAIGGAS